MLFEQKFEAMLRQYRSCIDDKKKFSGLVKDFFPEQAKNVNLLLMAYNLGIAEDMVKVSQINNTFAYRYVKQLIDNFGLSRVNADWVVSVWCVCYGGTILGKKCDISLQKQGAGPAIKEESNSFGKQYGDLFTYKKSSIGNGLSITSFNGTKKDTVIFQNRANNQSVIDIADQVLKGEQIEEAIITEGISVIGNGAFADCEKLHQVVLPISIKEIGDNAFENCKNLKSVSLPIQLEKLGAASLKGTGLRSITFPNSLYWVGESALAGCENLTQVTIPENIDRIPDGMFRDCVNLKKVAFHEQLEAIGDKAFFGCSNLDFIVIPDSVQSIGDDSFTGTDQRFIIQCSFGSYTEEYCRKKKIKYQLV